MGLMSTELPVDTYGFLSGTGSLGQVSSVVSKHLSLDELPGSQLFSLGSGGQARSPFFTPATGSYINVELTPSIELSTVVDEICFTFSLNKDELTQVCKVKSRKTLYNWIGGVSAPRKKAMSRLFDLLMLSEKVKSTGLVTSKELIHQKVANGQSVFDMLCAELIDSDLVCFSLSRLSLTSKNIKPLNDPFA